MTPERINPRISLNKLGEYITASPARRRRIIHDQKFPQVFITARYTDAQEVIAEYIAGGMRAADLIPKAMDRLLSLPPRTEWESQNNNLCAEALDHFLEVAEQLDIGDADCSTTDPEQPASVAIANVEISVRPEVVLTVTTGKRKGTIGAIKLAFSKTFKLSEEAGEHIASLLFHYMDKTKPRGLSVSREKCILVDVFGEQITLAPKSYKRRMKDVVAACQEIDALWPKIK